MIKKPNFVSLLEFLLFFNLLLVNPPFMRHLLSLTGGIQLAYDFGSSYR